MMNDDDDDEADTGYGRGCTFWLNVFWIPGISHPTHTIRTYPISLKNCLCFSEKCI